MRWRTHRPPRRLRSVLDMQTKSFIWSPRRMQMCFATLRGAHPRAASCHSREAANTTLTNPTRPTRYADASKTFADERQSSAFPVTHIKGTFLYPPRKKSMLAIRWHAPTSSVTISCFLTIHLPLAIMMLRSHPKPPVCMRTWVRSWPLLGDLSHTNATAITHSATLHDHMRHIE